MESYPKITPGQESQPRYIVCRSRRTCGAAEHWARAERLGLPVVTVLPRRLYATVELDMIVAPCRLDRQAMLAIDAMRTTDRRGCYDTGECRVGYAAVARVPIDQAEAVAAEVYAIALDCIARHAREVAA